MNSIGSSAKSAESVIAGFARDALSAALAATHRAGFGPQARVIDGARGDVEVQLERLGLRIAWETPPAPDVVLIAVNAPGRTAVVADVFLRLGAEFVTFAAMPSAKLAAADTVVSLIPDIRIGDRSVPHGEHPGRDQRGDGSSAENQISPG